MHTYTTFAAIATALLPSVCLAEQAKNLIFFGNSFTMSGGGVEHIVRDIAVAAGRPAPFVASVTSGGMNLTQHAAFASFTVPSSAPPGVQWDYAVMQEASTRPTSVAEVGGDVPAFLSASHALFGAVRNHSPQARAVMFETWARGLTHPYYTTYWPGPSAMQSELRTNYLAAVNSLNAAFGNNSAAMAPVGDAFEAGAFDLSLYNSDIYHASNKGALLISLVIYARVYDDLTTSDIPLNGIAAGLGLVPSDIAHVTAWADSVLVPTPSTLGLLAVFGLLAPPRRRCVRPAHIAVTSRRRR